MADPATKGNTFFTQPSSIEKRRPKPERLLPIDLAVVPTATPRGMRYNGDQPLPHVAGNRTAPPDLPNSPRVERSLIAECISHVATDQDDRAPGEQRPDGSRRQLGDAHWELVIPLMLTGEDWQEIDAIEPLKILTSTKPHDGLQPTPGAGAWEREERKIGPGSRTGCLPDKQRFIQRLGHT